MKNEASDTTMLAVTVIALAVVVVIGFGIFQYARSSLNSGSDKLSGALDTVNASDFADYDQKTVSGTKVVSALQNFEGSAAAILIRTNALKESEDEGNKVEAYASPSNERYFVNYSGMDKDGNAVGEEKDFINYNAILATNDSGTTAALSDSDPGEAELTLDDGTYTFQFGFYSEGGIVQFYTVKKDYQTTGMTEYLANGTRFSANLIKDRSGTILGVVFEQIN